MKITQEKYQKLKEMDLVNAARYDINARVCLIIQEVQ